MSEKPKTIGEAQERDWRVRAILRAKGRTTPMGAVLMTLLGSKRGRPAWGQGAMIHPNGNITSTLIDTDGTIKGGQLVCTVTQYQDFLSQLAHDCELTDEECVDLFKRARQWIQADMRADKDLHFWIEHQRRTTQ